MARKKAAPVVEAEPIDYEAMTELDCLMAARAEQKAMKEASATGAPIPATPALDEYHRRFAIMTATKATNRNSMKGKNEAKKNGTGRTPGVKRSTLVRFTHDGIPMHESHMLGGVAFHYTLGLGPKGAKLDSKGLADLLTELGVKDIYKPGWSVKLPAPSGVVIGAIDPSTVDAVKAALKKAKGNAPKPPKGTTTKKATTAKKPAGKTTGASKPTTRKGAGTAPAKPKAPVKKAAGDRGKVSRTVTPIPKKQPVKRGTPKKVMARKAS